MQIPEILVEVLPFIKTQLFIYQCTFCIIKVCVSISIGFTNIFKIMFNGVAQAKSEQHCFPCHGNR